ncbi:MAG: 3-hydroxybutyryl-CoA dehydrogenase [Candidatus Latescibacteria bacterium]|nr:3-hydroxybutyryl-CoA dehydrogenase [Candidatus Latescibacterota bacterium]
MQRIAVIGAGTMGAGIAQVLAQSGLEVRLYDADPKALEKTLENLTRRLRQQVEKGRLSSDAGRKAQDALAPLTALAQLDWAQMVIEAVPERLDLKREVFAQLDAHCAADAILASNTSGLDVGQLTDAPQRRRQVIGMHFFNPPPVMPLVELISTPYTDPTVLKTTRNLAERLGKTPIVAANKPGFAVNRILFPMINEAICALEEGVATAEDIDRALQLGASHPIGPLALADFVGLDVTLDILDSFAARMGAAKYQASPLLRAKVARGELGRKTGRGFFTYT